MKADSSSTVSAFLANYRAASRRPLLRAETTLRSFFQQYAPLRPCIAKPQLPDRPLPDALEFSQFLNELGGTLAHTRRSGGFLNIWSIARLKRDELRTTAVLAWAIDPHESHGKRHAVFSEILRSTNDPDLVVIATELTSSSDYSVRTEFCPLGERENRVDIAVEGANWLVVIEAKIDAPEGGEQLVRYAKAARERASVARKKFWALIYLSERAPSSCVEGIRVLRWRDVAASLRRASPMKLDFVDRLLLQFADHLTSLH